MCQLFLAQVQTALSASKQKAAQHFELHFRLAGRMSRHPEVSSPKSTIDEKSLFHAI
jgi:hypothetical protein